MKDIKAIIHANGIDIRVSSSVEADYISLTDIAKYRSDDPNAVIQNWLRNRNTIEFLGLWEKMNNPTFKPLEFEGFKKEAGLNGFTLSPKKWIEATNAIGIISKSGRYGGTYAHSDIAFEFASWISPEFKLYIIKDYQRLKTNESHQQALAWSVKREIAKTNYRIHTDAIKDNLLPPHLSKQEITFTYASEADLINKALFGITAKEWRQKNPDAKGNIRDAATIEQLIVLANLETMNAEFIREGLPQSDRLFRLNQIAIYQMNSFLTNTPKSIQELKKLQ
ncbi:DNA-binding protein [Megasphaera sp. ASD88]|uniref:KilA-N domain-containing protein n=1 Tax=Megasphaera TaxID=906 RepID=UPI000BAB4D02|nr:MULTISPECIES: KilA-N domain-containing protein [Megasphaera]MBM6732875.1 KilA-N domain-containing protein [Megasphaera stantonii]PAV38669.1 DNA-binding protein [Megasphaera sp. ASD88]